jgi:O-antigen/teichoic acid export membrane protein
MSGLFLAHWRQLRPLAKLLSRERARQTLLLYGSELALIALTLGTGIINSRFLGPVQYGIYTLVITIVDAIMIFSGFGYPQAGARVVALAGNPADQRAMHGALLLIALAMGAGMSALLALGSPLIALLFHTRQQHCLLVAAALCSTVPLQLILVQSCRGGNRIGVLAMVTMLPKALYLVGALAVVFWWHLTAQSALLLFYGGTLAACALALCCLRVRFANLRGRFREVHAEVRRYGFKAYVGSLADLSTFKLNNLLIAGYVDVTWLGFYNIAATMVSPMVRFSTSLSSSAFRSLAQRDRLDKRLVLANAAFLAVSGLAVALCARAIIRHVLTPQFLPAAGLTYVLAGTAFFQGLYQPLNAFLAAHGRGRELRAISFSVSVINLGVAVALIPRFGAYGAAAGSVVAKGCELLGNAYFYRKITRQAQQPAIGLRPVRL